MGIRELRDTLTKTIRDVRAGESIEITHDGEPVALLSPVVKGRLERLVAAGLATAPERPLVLRRRFPVTGAMTASEALEDDRNSR
jgi:antitoxin (DNA-binding transcriptional repressor) of toxin-antitoxin stability system